MLELLVGGELGRVDDINGISVVLQAINQPIPVLGRLNSHPFEPAFTRAQETQYPVQLAGHSGLRPSMPLLIHHDQNQVVIMEINPAVDRLLRRDVCVGFHSVVLLARATARLRVATASSQHYAIRSALQGKSPIAADETSVLTRKTTGRGRQISANGCKVAKVRLDRVPSGPDWDWIRRA